jgi:hypothetical protein
MPDINEAILNKIDHLAKTLGCSNVKVAQFLKELREQGEIHSFSIYNKHIWVYPYTGNSKLLIFGHYGVGDIIPVCDG